MKLQIVSSDRQPVDAIQPKPCCDYLRPARPCKVVPRDPGPPLHPSDAPELRQLLARIVASARETWPGVDLPPDLFLAYLRQRVPEGQAPAEALPSLYCDDLYLACACAAGDERALACFDRQLLPRVPGYVAKIDPSPSFADEVAQLLRHKLFVADGASQPRILSYGGRGPLGAWLRVAAVRTARNLQRSTRRSAALGDAGAHPPRSSFPDPEVSYLKQHYHREFRLALEKTLTSLPRRRRNVLRLYYLDQLSSTAIAAIYQVSGAAVRQWLKQSRQAILDETRALLGERLGLGASELDSLMALVQSQFDLSVSRLLRKTTSG
jgi:RNA polymerase sigma-70 factor (ECF subfamily)